MKTSLMLALFLASAVGCGGGGGGIGVRIENNTGATITRIEFQDLTDAVVAAADVNVPPGGIWNGSLSVPVGQYWVVTYGDDGVGGSCASDPHACGIDCLTDVEPDDELFVFIFNGFFCDGDDF